MESHEPPGGKAPPAVVSVEDQDGYEAVEMKLLSPELKTLLVEGETGEHSGTSAQLYVSADGATVEVMEDCSAEYATPASRTILWVGAPQVEAASQVSYSCQDAVTVGKTFVSGVLAAVHW